MGGGGGLVGDDVEKAFGGEGIEDADELGWS